MSEVIDAPVKINDPQPRGHIISSMAAQFDPWGPPPFDLSRDYVLTYSTPPMIISNLLTRSTTRSVYRLHWNTIAVWHDFGARVIQYWNAVPQHDKQGNVITSQEYGGRFRAVGYSQAGNEGDVKALINEFVQPVHSAAANGRDGAPRPSDLHSKLQRWEQGVEANAQAGVPDFVMVTEYGYLPRRVTAMVEVKNPWQVTPPLIDRVIQNQVPLSGLYPARLALEQLYGYMVRNGKEYGILTTLKGWCFARRANEGQFYITQMFGDFQARDGISQGATAEGYNLPQGFSIMQALYYLSVVAEAAPNLPETPIGGRPGQVTLPHATVTSAAAPTIQQPAPGNPGFGLGGFAAPHAGQGHQIGHQGVQILDGYDQSECAHYDDAFKCKDFQFEPWLPENNLGPKTWIAIALPIQSKVILKLWDAWKFDEEARNREASVYLQLRSLWGKCVPSLFVKSALEYFHALIFQYIRGSPLSPANLNSSVEKKVLAAFDEIHSLNVVHGDVRPANILVAEDGNKVWIIDFEDGEIVTNGDEEWEFKVSHEMEVVREMLRDIKTVPSSSGCLPRLESGIPTPRLPSLAAC